MTAPSGCCRGTVGSEVQAAAQEAIFDAIMPPETFTVNSAIDEAKGLIGQTAQLEFKERTCDTIICANFTDADLGLNGDDLERAEAAADPVGVGWVVNLQFDGRGLDIFSELTQRIAGVQTKRIAIFLDDQEILAPVSRAWIRDGSTQISGDFTREDARRLSDPAGVGPAAGAAEADPGERRGPSPGGRVATEQPAGRTGRTGLGARVRDRLLPDGGSCGGLCPGVLRHHGAGGVQAHPDHAGAGPYRRVHPVGGYGRWTPIS